MFVSLNSFLALSQKAVQQVQRSGFPVQQGEGVQRQTALFLTARDSFSLNRPPPCLPFSFRKTALSAVDHAKDLEAVDRLRNYTGKVSQPLIVACRLHVRKDLGTEQAWRRGFTSGADHVESISLAAKDAWSDEIAAWCTAGFSCHLPRLETGISFFCRRTLDATYHRI